MARRGSGEAMRGINMTPLIDIIFQLMIFFIFTVKAEENMMSENIVLALAPHGKTIEKKDPLEIRVEVDSEGKIRINRSLLSTNVFSSIIAKAVTECKGDLPVVIMADGKVQHKFVRKVMDICSSKGVWKLKLMALKGTD